MAPGQPIFKNKAALNEAAKRISASCGGCPHGAGHSTNTWSLRPGPQLDVQRHRQVRREGNANIPHYRAAPSGHAGLFGEHELG